MSLLGGLGSALGLNKNTVGTLKNMGIGLLTGGPAGAATALLGDVLSKTQKVTTTNPAGAIGQTGTALSTIARLLPGAQQPVSRALVPSINIANAGPGFSAPPPQLPDSTRTSGVSLFPGGPMVGTQTQYFSPPGAPGQPGQKGYHLNKSGYYTKGGHYVAPQSKWVKNRRRNPLNPRALSRSISRISSAKNAAKFLGRVTVRDRAACN